MTGKLEPLGNPVQNGPKWFCAVEMIRLATDRDWLHKATKEIAKYLRKKCERRLTPALLYPQQNHKVQGEKITMLTSSNNFRLSFTQQALDMLPKSGIFKLD